MNFYYMNFLHPAPRGHMHLQYIVGLWRCRLIVDGATIKARWGIGRARLYRLVAAWKKEGDPNAHQ